MDANRLIELARDCGMFITTEMRWQIEQWERLAAAVTDEIATPAIAVEREACAKVCDERAWGIGGPAANCASDIRGRSNAEVKGAPLAERPL